MFGIDELTDGNLFKLQIVDGRRILALRTAAGQWSSRAATADQTAGTGQGETDSIDEGTSGMKCLLASQFRTRDADASVENVTAIVPAVAEGAS